MLFTSFRFILFLAVLFAVYYTIPKKYQWMMLLAASYLFYFFAGAKYILYILATTISAYLIGWKIGTLQKTQTDFLKLHKDEISKDEKKAYKTSIKSKKWKWLLLCLFFNFGILAVLKYGNFVISNVNFIFNSSGSGRQLSFLNLALPLGISFYTFQIMGYVIDVYRGIYPSEKNPFKLALFVSFFPQLIQGPISRFNDLSKTLFKEHSFDSRNLSFGLQRITWGFFKKVVIADRIIAAVNTIFKDPETYQGSFVFVGMLFYAFQLYADFTGGIDITIGIAEVLGIEVKENFERPYFSKSITEYWRRWHITLGTWFKEYVFYPVSVCRPMLNLSKFSRKHFGESVGKRVPVYISTIIVWFITGLWHGASWNFIVWGLMNCAVILISQELIPFYRIFHNKFNIKDAFPFRLFQVLRTVLLMSSIRLFDCYRNVPVTFIMFGTMFTKFNINIFFNGELLNLGLKITDYYVLIFSFLIIVTVSLIQRGGSVRERMENQMIFVPYLVYYALLIFILIFGAYGIGYDSSQFIYNQF
ncbi:MAG: MBOAT family protein [Bacillota bacterium]|nr:MBOAT family protein [Bacillota bacterium]